MAGQSPLFALFGGIKNASAAMRGMFISGALAGLGGAYFPLAELGFYSNSMIGGRGFIALALVVTRFRRSGKLDIAVWHQLREDNQPPFEEPELPEEPLESPQAWPSLAPAGLPPEVPPEQTDYRDQV